MFGNMLDISIWVIGQIPNNVRKHDARPKILMSNFVLLIYNTTASGFVK